ncbi:hypothetical protein HN011_007057 [Eciton burchellii]|nr:hypothetical protein HN011_007057 [Eciton burchellii]
MSNESFADAATSAHAERLRAPKSLHGVEDVEVIWDTITRRFPNAAPLLCEMETVIERAEDLLQQLKTPSNHDNDTSSSFHTPDSRESNATISIGSDIESFTEETNDADSPGKETEYPDAVENVETSYVVQDVHEIQVDLESENHSERSNLEDEPAEYHSDSSPGLDETAEDLNANPEDEGRVTQGESDINVTRDSADKGLSASSEERLMAMVTEQNSLEGWTKITEEALREWREHADIEANETDVEIEIKKIDIDQVDNCLLTSNDEEIDNKSDDTKILAGSVQVLDNCASSVEIRRRLPFVILEEYAKRCKVSVKYEYKSKPNLHVINGDLCGFRAMSCAETQEQAKNELASKILWMVAEHQMDGSKVPSTLYELLPDLSREEMLEIIGLKDDLKNASHRLYKLCLETGQPFPEYTVRNMKTNRGFMYAAQCSSFDLIGIGQGLRKDSAKVAAAENLYEKYTRKVEQRT